MIVFFLMQGVVGVTSAILAKKALRKAGCIDRLLAFGIFYFSGVVLTELALGMAGLLSLWNVIALNLAILLAVSFMSREKAQRGISCGIKDAFFELSGSKVACIVVSIILGFGLTKVFVNLLNPPFGWDSLNYHFTFPVEWLKSHNLSNPITISDDPSPTYYPINGSLWYLWLILPLKSVFLADLGQVPFFIFAFLAVVGISRKLGLERKEAFLAAGLFLLIPNFFKQLEIAYVDVMVAALFLSCLNYQFALKKDFSAPNALLYGLSAGLLLGTKTVALPYVAILLVPFVYLALKRRKARLLLLAAGLTALLGAFSYIRNFLDTGNPLYPLDLAIGGRTVFKGVMDSATYAAHFKTEDYAFAKMLFHEGLGGQTLVFVLPFIFLGLPIALARRRKELDFSLAYFLILPVLIFLAYRYLIPLANVRYLYPLLAAGMIIGFYSMKAAGVPFFIVRALSFVCALVSVFEITKRKELYVSLAATALVLAVLYAAKKARMPKGRARPAVLGLAAACALLGLFLLEKDYTRNEFRRYREMVRYSGFWPDATYTWEWLNNETTGDEVAYTGRPVPFPLYGSGFKKNVSYVSVNAVEPALLHYFPESYYRWEYDFSSLHKELEREGNYRSGGSYDIWSGNLRARQVTYLFVYSLHETKEIAFPVEDAWARAHPGIFSPVFENKTIRIYRLKGI